MSQFIEMYKDLLVNGKIEDLVDRKIASVKKSYHDSDEIEYIDISSIDNISNTIVETTKYEVSNAPSRAQQCVKKGDILVSTVRPINRNIAVVTRGLQNLVASTGFCVLRPKEEYREYLLSIVKSDAYTEHMCDKASGGLYPAVNNGDVFSYGIHIPNKELAQKVSTIHHQADKSEFVGFKSQFIEMFEGNKYPRLSLDNIAKEWLKGQGFKKDDICEDGNTKCIHYGELFTKYGPVITEVASRTYVEKKKISKIGDILFPASDVTPNGLARCSMLPFNDVILGGDIIVLRPKDEYSPAYLSYAINQQTSQLLTRVNGGVVKHMSAKGLKTVEIPIPPKDKQEEYIQFAHQADKSEYYN